MQAMKRSTKPASKTLVCTDFKVTYPNSQKSDQAHGDSVKTSAGSEPALQKSPFRSKDKPDALDTEFLIEPAAAWKAMAQYSNFIIYGEKYSISDDVYVRHQGTPEKDASEGDYWVAKILEVRASSSSNVMTRVMWYYSPKDLPKKKGMSTGARAYHGRHELIASNHMDVVDVNSFAGKALVVHWLEDDEEELQRGLYWRQTLDHRTSRLSNPRKHCICGKNYNPDRMMVFCSQDDCRIWNHEECLLNDAVTRRLSHDKLPRGAGVGKGKSKRHRQRDQSRPSQRGVSAHLLQGEGEILRLNISDLRPETAEGERISLEDIVCLKCGSNII
ncbi:MAG: hypothetical protein M1818_001401 [Claussenomyces sp. TS43310]|nr:MAG: hypothetical protein M1818_001401 [Claussenomyces sp. TS43310]